MRELTRSILQMLRQQLEDEQGQVRPEETFHQTVGEFYLGWQNLASDSFCPTTFARLRA